MTKPKRKVEVGFLTAGGKGGGRTVLLEALGFALRRHLVRSVGQLAVTVYERDGRVRIARQINVSVNNDSFIMSKLGKTPETFEIEPPAPFAGSARYSRSPGVPPSWTGNLTVDFSSTERIPLTGPGFGAVFCRGFALTRLKHCP